MKRLVFAAAALAVLSATPALAASPIRLCTGAPSGLYYAAGDEIAKVAGKTLAVVNVETEGTLDNLERLLDLPADDPQACDAMVGQPDGPVYVARSSPAKVKKLKQVATLHREYLHVLCSKKSGVSDLGDLENDPARYSLAVGDVGSGAWLAWQNLVAADEDYGKVPQRTEGGDIALAAVASGETTCMLVPAGLGNGTVMEADATYGDTVVLVGANDRDFTDAINIAGEPLYSWEKIPAGTYPHALQSGWFSAASTISWPAAVYVNTERMDRGTLNAFIRAASRGAVSIKAEYGQ